MATNTLERPIRRRSHFNLDRPIVHRGAVAVAADFHVPLTDHKYVGRFLEHCRTAGMKTLIVAGDFWNLDSPQRVRLEAGVGRARA
jgi:hypothetical protein